MEHEEKYSIVILFIVVIVSVSAVAFMLANSKNSQPKPFFNQYFLTGGAVRHYCIDSDGGINPYERGITRTERFVENGVVDRCTNIGVIEYSCTVTGELLATNIPCPFGCYAGSCMKHSLVGYSFDPFLNSRVKDELAK